MQLFRVYDKANHRWITDDVLIDSGGGAETIDNLYLPDEVAIELFTGVYDSEGNQIYVGDILKENSGAIGEVRYDAVESGYQLVPEAYRDVDIRYPYPRASLGFIARECTVIGNIHGLEMEE